MRATRRLTHPVPLKPCSLAAADTPAGPIYAVACYELQTDGYTGEVVFFRSSEPEDAAPSILAAPGGVFRVYHDPDEGFVCCTTSGHVLTVPDLSELTTPTIWTHADRPYLTDVDLVPGRFVVTDDKGRVHVADRSSGQMIASAMAHKLAGTFECPAWSCAFLDESGEHFASVGDDAGVLLWDSRVLTRPVAKTEGADGQGTVFVDRHFSDPNSFIVGGYGGSLGVYDSRKIAAGPVQNVQFPGGVWHVDVLPDKSLAVAACMQAGVVVFELSSLAQVAEITGSALSYGATLCTTPSGLEVGEVEFEGRKLNLFSIVQ